MDTTIRSDWDEYYKEEKFSVPPFILDELFKNYESLLRRYAHPRSGLVVMELGGANSCFYEAFRQGFPISTYHIVDNNRYGLNLFKHRKDPGVFLHEFDLLRDDPQSLGVKADIVYSAGLIEHFVPADTRNMVASHFALTKPGGFVLMSFPTPTVLYWAFRHLLECTGRFPPLFERPIPRSEIVPAIGAHGMLLENYTMWKTILTQMVVLAQKP